MSFLQFLIDDMCAKLSVEVMSELVHTRLSRGPCTIDDLALEITGTDPTLDIKSAKILAQAGVDSLAPSGEITVRDDYISLART